MKIEKKSVWLSRTVWLAIAQALVGILTAVLAADPDLQKIGGLLMLKSSADLLLRVLTEKPLDL